MVFLICAKHNKAEKSASNLMTSVHICMDRDCAESYKILCQVCKKEHKNHAITLLNIEDVSFLLERLIKLPFKTMGKPFGEALNIMQQLKMIKEFRKKIDVLEKEIQKQSLDLIDATQILLQEYTQSQVNATSLSILFQEIQEQSKYQEFVENCSNLLNTLNYNVKRDRLEYGNPFIHQTESKRVKIIESVKCKIQEVRDYSMKIIEVILNNYESQDESEELNYQQKNYDRLKQELLLENDRQKQKQCKNEVSFSHITTNISQITENYCEIQMQTYGEVFTFEQLQQKLSTIRAQKQVLKQQLQSLKQKYASKQKLLNKIEQQMRGNRHFRSQKLRLKEDLVNKIIQIWSQKGSDCEDAHS